ncbi:MAG: hypothetical protein EOP11_06530 [Proteobacteria bacterium]|nr:MAG: hypothetical protein EOP11_06530 [Pseudomonadota bacterium]
MKFKSALALSLLALANPTPAAYAAHTVIDALKPVMAGCPARVWPNYTWQDFYVMEVAADNTATLLAGKSGKIIELSEAQVPGPAKLSPYAFFKVEGGSGMSVNQSIYEAQLREANGPSEESMFTSVVALAAHEAFHHVGQKKWVGKSGVRGTELPILAKPRLYRRALLQRMMQAFQDPSARELKLGQAKFWFDKWRNEFPREYLNSMDLSEGTAEYAGLITTALARLGCGATEIELRAELLAVVNGEAGNIAPRIFDEPKVGHEFALDNEGYSTGALAGFLLRFDLPPSQWEITAAAGTSPLELLFRGVSARADELDPTYEGKLTIRESEEQAKTTKLLAPAVDNLSDPKAVIVAMPSAWATEGTYSPSGFYYDPAKALQFIPLALPISFANAAAHAEITAAAKAVMVDGLNNSPCAAKVGYWHTLVPAKALVKIAGGFEIKDPYLQGRMLGKLKRGPDGRRWLCGATE